MEQNKEYILAYAETMADGNIWIYKTGTEEDDFVISDTYQNQTKRLVFNSFKKLQTFSKTLQSLCEREGLARFHKHNDSAP